MTTITNKQMAAETGVSIALVFLVVVYFWWWMPGARGERSRPDVPVPEESLSIVDAHPKGSEAAEVAIVAFSDFQCPFCARFATGTLKAIEDLYVTTGKIVVAYRHTPLSAIQPMATRAAEAAECAAEQGQFWELHDQLYANSRRLTSDVIDELAAMVGVNLDDYRDCMAGDVAQKVQNDVALSERLSIRSTPTFMIGRLESGQVHVQRVIVGAVELEEFRQAIDEALASTAAMAMAMPR
ncbi:MAG: hypothetical protein ABS36_00010 [Acidobacteria bacterium SCN 69-37]|nr:MAG: hypothetical protein ABS36_00010 [Acidobacteria bacterium SCN 69-37]